MNILEHYIHEIHAEEPYVNAVDDNGVVQREYIQVYFTVDCHGSKSKIQRVYEKAEWEAIKKKGYFMG